MSLFAEALARTTSPAPTRAAVLRLLEDIEAHEPRTGLHVVEVER